MNDWDDFMDEMNEAWMEDFLDHLPEEDEAACDWYAEQAHAYWD